MNPEEQLKKAFDFSADLTKQLITLATAIIPHFRFESEQLSL